MLVLNIDQCCRLCLETSDQLNGVLAVELNKDQAIDSLIFEYLNIKIAESDELPNKVCKNCVTLLTVWSNFHKSCIKNDEKLKSYIQKSTKNNHDEDHKNSFEGTMQVIDPKLEYNSSTDDETEKKNDNISKDVLCQQMVETIETVIEEFPGYMEEVADDVPSVSNSVELSNSVDDNIMQDIILAVLGDPDNHEIDLPTIEDNCKPINMPLSNNEENQFIKSLEPTNFFICKYCDAAFNTRNSCEQHEIKAHDTMLPYNCDVCSYKFLERLVLIEHLRNEHKCKKPYQCYHCKKSYKKQAELKSHCIKHAGWKKPFLCGICDQRFTRRNNLRHHLKIHTGERFACSLCNKSFSTLHGLKEHEDNHKNSDDYKCSLCGLILSRKRRLVEHEKICFKKSLNELAPENIMVVNVDPSASVPVTEDNYNSFDANLPSETEIGYTCDQCPKRFSKKKSLTSHKLTHNADLRSQTCSMCTKVFLRKYELERHVTSIHKQIKNFKCEVCDKSFSRKDKLLRHTKVHKK